MLSLADLQVCDPSARGSGRNRRYLCPECGDEKPRDAAHRVLVVDFTTGAFTCHRCKLSGKLSDWWTDRPSPSPSPAVRSRVAARRAFEPAPQTAPPPPPETPRYDYGAELRRLVKLSGTPGADYLSGRGLSGRVRDARYSPCFLGRPAVVFALRGESGSIVGLSGRYVDGLEHSKRTIKQSAERGIYAPPGTLQSATVLITEAPIDAASLSECWVSALATNGTAFPDWLAPKLAPRRVICAHDRDGAGESAAIKAADALGALGTPAARLSPPEGHKDWNAALQGMGTECLRAWVLGALRAVDPEYDPFADP